MIINNCVHEWEKHVNATRVLGEGAIPAYFICKKCNAQMTAPEVFQLEALKSQTKTLNHLTGFQKKMLITTSVISIVSTVAFIVSLIIK